MALSESQALKIIEEQLGSTYTASARGLVRLGIGDDAACLGIGAENTLWTVDACNEGSHFLMQWLGPEDVAHKSFQAALSDIPAMGAKPTAALCQLSLSREVTPAWLGRFARAQGEVSRETKTPIVGGNVCFGDRVGVVTTVLGSAPTQHVLRRSRAQVGDEIWLVGAIGLARAGLLLLQAGGSTRGRAARSCLRAFRRPRALVREGLGLRGRATACLDVSDGLTRDAGNLAHASGVRLVLDAARLSKRLPEELEAVGRLLGESPLQLALRGGEDYALLATGPANKRPRFAHTIGTVEKGRGVFLDSSGKRQRLTGGFEHGGRRR